MKKLVVLTGAGISAESGLKTFRDSDGLWEGHDVMEVATPEGWYKNPKLVLDFYNARRKQALSAQPNQAHRILKSLEDQFDVTVITQNVDHLHEMAGSSKVIHLHGQLFESRSTIDERLVYKMDHWELKLGDRCEKGSQLRPNIVWFGEAVPMMEVAIDITQQADILVIVGTSMVVYPAAGLMHYAKSNTPIYVIDPVKPSISKQPNLHFIEEKATIGVQKLKEILA
uniref:SIR2 family NAD-dependent protein deacylase n=1 Tax=Roseivirga sp. TaxID=1964215 RepID=UPI0040489B2C